MKNNLSKKIFIITLSLLLGLMIVIFIFQTFFFQSFYELKKKNNLVKDINRFTSLYANQTQDYNSIGKALIILESETNSRIGIFSSITGDTLYISDSYSEDTAYVRTLKQLLKNNNLRKEIIASGKPQTIDFIDPNSNSTKIGVLAPMSLYSTNDSILISVTSIQPIQEASDVIREFYSYIFIGFIFISILLSTVYTNLISKPLIKINNVAKKMSQMNFNEKCKIDREDEIGNLASTLNFLSSNLDGALQDLKEKNKKLEEDIEKERNLKIMRKDFVDSVSHELKTPIGIIEGYAEGLKDGIVSGDNALEYLETIIDESKKMSILVTNMLEISRLESGVIKPNLEIFNINRLIKNLVNKFTIEANENGLRITFDEKTDFSYVKADRFKMEQVLTNLITNAIKYTPENNDIVVSISMKDSFYEISVINYGIQIDKNDIDKLFNKFYRIDKARSRNKNSTGLGLSIVKNILDIHNFNYSLNNIENAVEFKFLLPVENPPEE